MSTRPRKGQPVAFSRELAVSPPVEAISGLRFNIQTLDGGEVLVDYAHLAPRWLALAFARALRRLAGLGGRLSVRSTVATYARILPLFFAYMTETEGVPSAPELLQARHVDGFEAWLAAKGKSPIHLLTILTKVIVALREVASEGRITFSDTLRNRLAYTTLTPMPASRPRDAYSPYIARQLRDAARADIGRIFQRFREPRPVATDSDLKVLEDGVHANIDARGILLHTDRKYKALLHARRVRGLSSENFCHQLHGWHYLTSQDVIPLMVFLALETGLEIECCMTLTVDCLQNPANGTVEIAYIKRRARGAEHKTLRVRDGSPRTPGGLIRQVVAITAAARRHRPSDNLWLHYGSGGLKSRLKHPQYLVDGWTT
ncbi:hypothetical protein EOA75_31995, partial [Mesorhizobium sp. M1A.F.Ca.IN.022.07.1.1]